MADYSYSTWSIRKGRDKKLEAMTIKASTRLGRKISKVDLAELIFENEDEVIAVLAAGQTHEEEVH